MKGNFVDLISAVESKMDGSGLFGHWRWHRGLIGRRHWCLPKLRQLAALVLYSGRGLDQNEAEGTGVSPRVVLGGGGDQRWALDNSESVPRFGGDEEEFQCVELIRSSTNRCGMP
jgi:hypothetical protein